MNAATIEDLVAQAKLLPAEDRELLLLRLQVEFAGESADRQREAAWIAEAERRLDAVERGQLGTVPWATVRQDLGLP